MAAGNDTFCPDERKTQDTYHIPLSLVVSKEIPPNLLLDTRRFGGIGLQFHNVDGAGTFWALLDIKADPLTFGK